MYCPKCGTQNPDGAQLCRSCNGVLTSTSITAENQNAKTSRLAIASLVLGILSFFTFLLTALPAIILGIVALVKIGKSAGRLKGKGLAIAGICVPPAALIIIGLPIAFFVVTEVTKVATDVGQARVTTTKANLRILHYAVCRFKIDTGRFPTKEEGLMALIEQPSDVKNWEPGGYLETIQIPKDGWGNDFIYDLYPESSKPFVIKSLGADGKEGGEGIDADLLSIDSW
jgi:general secretion pathway protein G